MNRRLAPVAALLLLGVAACAEPADEAEKADSTEPSAATTAGECDTDNLPLYEDGQLTVATDSPAYVPWFINDDPTNGKGYESALTYEVADRLGFSEDQVEWVKVRFNNSYKPGAKEFDFDINQIAITEDRAGVVDFSSSYYNAAQAVIALDDNKFADVTSVSALKLAKLGAQTGTTSLLAIRDVIDPEQEPLVFTDTNAAKQALMNGQVDAILADVPTASYITEFEIPAAEIIGQFQADPEQSEQFGMLFEKGNPLVACVDAALDEMRSDGTLDGLEDKWLSEYTSVPVLPQT
jgi:polar amino acid transport system substrate-binding protein